VAVFEAVPLADAPRLLRLLECRLGYRELKLLESIGDLADRHQSIDEHGRARA